MKLSQISPERRFFAVYLEAKSAIQTAPDHESLRAGLRIADLALRLARTAEECRDCGQLLRVAEVRLEDLRVA